MSTTLAEQNQDLLNAGLIDQNAALTATGSRLLERSETAGEDPDEMLDFYLKGWIDADLNLTQDGNIWEGVMERGLEDILSEPNQEKGFQLYQQAKNNGALSYYKTQAGEEYEDMVQFLEHAAKNFAPMAGQLFGELVKVPGGLAQTYEVAQRSLPWYFQTPAGWLLGAIKGKPTEEELAMTKVGIDAYAKEALLRMPATMSYGAHAALTHHPVTGKLFTDEDRLRSAYLYRKAQFDIEQVETGTAVAAAIDFGATMATTVADVATLGLQSEELEELIEDFREKNIYGDEGVEARVKGAEQQLNELDRIEGNDPDLPWYQRPSQTKTRAEIAKETGTAVGMILSPDTLTPFAFAALGRSAVTATMRKSMQLSGELVELQGKRQLLQSSQKAAAASPFGKGAASQLQRQIDNIDGTITATEKRLLRVSQAIEPRLLSAVGAMGRKIRSVPFKASGAALQSAGTLLKRMNPALSGLTQGAAFYGLTGGNPFVGALGVIAGMTGQGGRTFALGQRLSKVGLEWGKRRTALPFFRKLADESKDSVFRRQLFLAGDFALGKPVRMTRQFADYYRRAFIAEVPFSYIAAGGASYAGGNWLTDAMAEALAFEAPMAMGANVTGSLMGMKTAGTVEEQNRLATNAALNFRDEFLRDPEKRAVFDALPPVAKRALGNYHTAFPDLHWDFDVSVANGSSYYDSDSNTIRINPNDPRGAEAAMAHEFRHYLDAQGFEQGVVDELVGPSGILRLKDGSYMPSFVTWANNENKLRGDKWDLSRNDSSDWAEAALEWSAYSSMDGLASSVRHNALIKATQRHPWMRSLMDAIMPASYRQKSLMNMGLLFDSDGTVSVRKGLPGRDAYKQQAAIAKRVQRYMRDRAGIGATDADRADLHDPEKSKKDPNAILPNDQEGLNQVESVMTPDLEHDAQGNVIFKNGEAQLIPQETADARAGEGQPLFGPQIEKESNVSLPKVNVGRGTDNGTDLTGVAKMDGLSQTGALVGAARLKEMLRSLPFSDYQLGMFDEIVDILSDPSRRGESLLSFYFPVWRKKRGKGNWRNFVPKKGIAGKWGRWAPYALVQSDEGNLLVYGISHDQVAENIAILAKSASGRKLYDGSVGRIASDFELMVTNWGKDIKNITQFTDEQLNFLNAIFGNVGKGNPDFNPALLEAPFKKLRSAVRSYRLDRFARIQTLPRDPFPFALEKGRRRELPPEDLENYQGTHKAPTGEYGEGSLDAMDKTYPSDIYGPNGARYYGDGGDIDREAHRIIVAAKGNPTKRVKVYRAVPGNVDPETKINPGDWVTTVRQYAVGHGERFDEGSTILEAEVEAQEIFTEGNSILEFGYMPRTQTVYHGGTLDSDRHGGLLFTSADRRQAEAYAKEEGAPVRQFTIDPATIATEEQAFQVMEELGIVPLDPNLAGAVGRREGMLQEYLDNDPVFDYRIGEEQRRKFVAEMKSRGFTGVKSTGVNMVTTTDTNVQEYILFGVPKTQVAGDADYLAAVEAGDTETAQRMVDDAAGKAGYTTTGWHGSPETGITDFLVPAFFSNKKSIANTYKAKRGLWRSRETGEVTAAYLKLDNPLEFDAGGKRSDNIPFPGREWKQKVFGKLPEGAVSVEKAASLARNAGHDGLIVRNVLDSAFVDEKEKSDVFVVFDPSQIKSVDPVTYDDQGNVIPLSKRFDTGDDIRGEVGNRVNTPVAQPGGRREMPLEQPDQHGMRSSLVENLSDKVQGKRASADQLKALIAPKKGLVNQEEAKWLMVEDVIDRLAEKHNGKVPVAEFFEELRNRGDQLLDEVELRDDNPEITPDLWQLDERILREGSSAETAIAQVIDDYLADDIEGVFPANQRKRVPSRPIDVFENQELGTPMYGFVEALTDGDTAYRLLHHTIHGVRVPDGANRFRDKFEARSWIERFVEKRLEARFMDEHPKPIYGDYTLDGGVDYKERLLVVGEGRNIRHARSARDYDSPHFVRQTGRKAKGYVAHSRQKTRKAEDGTTGTFLEEVQSDRHQKGQTAGYLPSESDVIKLKVEQKIIHGQLIKAHRERTRLKQVIDDILTGKTEQTPITKNAPQEHKAQDELHARLSEKYREIEGKLTSGVPDAPYRDSNAWILALFKRALKDAVDQNHDWVGWTDGDTQNERYNIDLSDTFDFIRWDGDNLVAVTQEGTQVDESVRRADLSDYVGQNNADLLRERYDAAETEFYAVFQEALDEAVDKQLFDEGIDSMDDGWEARRDELNANDQNREEAYEYAFQTAPIQAVLEADDLVEGPGNPEPFRRMYDRQIPNVVNKYLKKHKVKASPDRLVDGQAFWRVEISDGLRADIQEKGQPRF